MVTTEGCSGPEESDYFPCQFVASAANTGCGAASGNGELADLVVSESTGTRGEKSGNPHDQRDTLGRSYSASAVIVQCSSIGLLRIKADDMGKGNQRQ